MQDSAVVWFRRDLRVADPEATFDDATAFMLREGVGRRDRKVIERETAEPLDRRG